MTDEQTEQDKLEVSNATDALSPSPTLPPTPPIETDGASTDQDKEKALEGEINQEAKTANSQPSQADIDQAQRHSLQPALYPQIVNQSWPMNASKSHDEPFVVDEHVTSDAPPTEVPPTPNEPLIVPVTATQLPSQPDYAAIMAKIKADQEQLAADQAKLQQEHGDAVQ
jgi:hypothetical protein